MNAKKRTVAAQKNAAKTQAKRKISTSPQRSLAAPIVKKRKNLGTGGSGHFYRIEIRSKGEFKSFRTQDVGAKGGLERITGKRPRGSWDAATWLVSKDKAHVSKSGELIIDDIKARTMLKQISGKISHVKADIFQAHPLSDISKKAKSKKVTKNAKMKHGKKTIKTKRK